MDTRILRMTRVPEAFGDGTVLAAFTRVGLEGIVSAQVAAKRLVQSEPNVHRPAVTAEFEGVFVRPVHGDGDVLRAHRRWLTSVDSDGMLSWRSDPDGGVTTPMVTAWCAYKEVLSGDGLVQPLPAVMRWRVEDPVFRLCERALYLDGRTGILVDGAGSRIRIHGGDGALVCLDAAPRFRLDCFDMAGVGLIVTNGSWPDAVEAMRGAEG